MKEKIKKIIDHFNIETGRATEVSSYKYSAHFWKRLRQRLCNHEKIFYDDSSPSYYECKKCKVRQ